VINMPADPSVVIEAAARCRKVRADECPAEGLSTRMSGAEAAARTSAAETATDVSGAEAAADVSAATKAAATKAATDVTATAAASTVERFSSRRPGESGSCDQNDHDLAQHRGCLHQMTGQPFG
jgi:hypothetical protein